MLKATSSMFPFCLPMAPPLQEVICNAQAEESRTLKASCETDLAEALPALESAVAALKSLSKGDIVEASVATCSLMLHLPVDVACSLETITCIRTCLRVVMLRAHHDRSSVLRSWLTQVKAMKKPPAAVKLVMEAVCIMMGVKPDKVKNPDGGTKKIDDYWGPAQKNLLGDSRFLQNLMDYDKDNMDSAMVEKVQNSSGERLIGLQKFVRSADVKKGASW